MVKKIVSVVVVMLMALTAAASTHKVRVTCYQPTTSQCNYNPMVTADGSKINMKKLKNGALRWCAVSRDLLKHYPYGSKIYIEGHGWYEVHDTCARRYTRLVDILIHPSDKGFTKRDVTVKGEA